MKRAVLSSVSGVERYAVAVAIASLLTAQRMRNTARTGLPGKPIPLFFVVAMFIDVAGLALAVLLMIPSMILSFTVGTLLATLAYIPGIVYPILRGLVLLEYRRELKELQNFAPSHAYVPAPAPAPEQKEAVQPLLRPYSAQERPSSPEDPQADRIRCPHCGASHAKDAVFCGSCGKELS